MFRQTVKTFCLWTAGLFLAGTTVVATPTVARADPLGGRIVKVDTVRGGYTDTWTFALMGRETTRIRLEGDGDTCLELRVYDENGNLVAADTAGWGDSREVLVTPRRTGKFQVKIKNVGRIPNTYVMVLD